MRRPPCRLYASPPQRRSTHPLARTTALLRRREGSYSDVFQVNPPIGPGGYVREAQYRMVGKAAAQYKTQRKPGDKRPFWRVAW